MSDGLATVTVTPGRTAALVSATLPLIEPVVLAPPPCANACVDASRHAASTATTRWNPRRFMNALLLLVFQLRMVTGRYAKFDSGALTDRQTPCSTQKPMRLTPKN